VVVDARSASPLQLLNPANDGAGAWVYLSSLGGGFVGADEVALDVEVRAGSTLFLSSQSSSKAYRASRSRFVMDVRVDAAAMVVVWPEPVTCFAGAGLTQVQRVSLADDASMLFVDAFTAGRVARDERWAFDALESRLSVDRRGGPWLREAVWLSSKHGALNDRMHGLDAFATVALAGPRFAPLATQLAEQLSRRSLREQSVVTLSPRDDGALLRIASPSVEALTQQLQELLRAAVVDVLGDGPPTTHGAR
jgi:urease accessory protein